MMLKKIYRKIKSLFYLNYHNETQNGLNLLASGGGERQASPTLKGIRDDHTGRYQLATKYIPDNSIVLDMACGVGYGSYIIATQTNCQKILAVDLSKEAIEYGKKFYSSEKINYQTDDCLIIPLENESFDIIVSFETVEHINEDQQLLKKFFDVLKTGGKLLLSTPNQLMMPFDSQTFPFHIRHYTPKQLTELLEDTGFSISQVFSQPNNQSSEIIEGWEGKFNIIICSK